MGFDANQISLSLIWVNSFFSIAIILRSWHRRCSLHLLMFLAWYFLECQLL